MLTDLQELPLQPSPALRSARLPRLSSERCASSRFLQPVPTGSSLQPPRPTSLPARRHPEPSTAARLPARRQLLPRAGSTAGLSSGSRVNGRRARGRRRQAGRRHRPAHPHGRGRHQAWGWQNLNDRRGCRCGRGRRWREEVQEGEGSHGLRGYRVQPRGEDGHVASLPVAGCGVGGRPSETGVDGGGWKPW